MSPEYAHAAEKFHAARRSLMLPHPEGEAASIAAAFLECSLALDPLDLWRIKAQGFDEDDQLELSRVVDELAEWFDRQT